MKQVEIQLNETSVCETLVDYFNSNIEEIQPAFSFSQCDQNDRVELGEITVNAVRFVRGSLVEIEYEYEWSFYSGCKDISDEGITTESIRGRVIDGKLEFDIYIPPDPRSTVDEF